MGVNAAAAVIDSTVDTEGGVHNRGKHTSEITSGGSLTGHQRLRHRRRNASEESGGSTFEGKVWGATEEGLLVPSTDMGKQASLSSGKID